MRPTWCTIKQNQLYWIHKFYIACALNLPKYNTVYCFRHHWQILLILLRSVLTTVQWVSWKVISVTVLYTKIFSRPWKCRTRKQVVILHLFQNHSYVSDSQQFYTSRFSAGSEKQRLVEGRSCTRLSVTDASIESVETRETLILQNPDTLQLYQRAVCLVQAGDKNSSQNVVRGTKLTNWRLFANATSNQKAVVCKFCHTVIWSNRKERDILLELYSNHKKLMSKIVSGIRGATNGKCRMMNCSHCTLLDDGNSVICNWCGVKFGLETNSAAPDNDNHLASEHCVILDNDLKILF